MSEGGGGPATAEDLLALIKKSAPELLALVREGRPPGELFSKIPWSESPSLDPSFQFALWCAECDAFLGVLGVFVLRPANERVEWPHRYAHCSRCHANTFFLDKPSSVEVQCKPPALVANFCTICDKESRPLETRADLLDTTAPKLANGVS